MATEHGSLVLADTLADLGEAEFVVVDPPQQLAVFGAETGEGRLQ